MINSISNQPRNLFGYWSDFWLTSGISILLIAGLLITGYQLEGEDSDGTRIISMALLLQLLLNWPHFMVSYRLLYRQSDCLKRFTCAAVIIPGLLAALVAATWLLAQGSPEQMNLSLLMSYGLWLIASFYLAWHYVGQAWGCLSTFTILSGHKWTPLQKHILYWSLRVLIVWHVVWAARLLPAMPWIEWIQSDLLYQITSCLAIVSFILSGYLLLPAWKAGKIDIRAIGIWFSIFFWYFAIYCSSDSIFWVQLAHSLQYLVFVARVEANQQAPSNPKIPVAVRVQLVYLGAVFAGALVFWQAELSTNLQSATPTLIGLIAIAINIHHYYVDSSIWKLRDAPTRSLLFGHLK